MELDNEFGVVWMAERENKERLFLVGLRRMLEEEKHLILEDGVALFPLHAELGCRIDKDVALLVCVEVSRILFLVGR